MQATNKTSTSTFVRDLEGFAAYVALMARIFPGPSGSASPVLATRPSNRPAPAAARILEVA